MTNIVVLGMGYVGIANAVMLAKLCSVTVLDISKEKIEALNKMESPIKDLDVEYYLKNEKLDIHAELNKNYDFQTCDIIIVALPTNYDEDSKTLNTDLILDSIKTIRQTNKNALIIIKSTIPIGFMAKISKDIDCSNIVFSPEFLREGKALYDNLNPTRIIFGTLTGENTKSLDKYISILKHVLDKKDAPIITMNYTEAEAVKIFSNTYLAMRVAFFNELDTYAESKGLDTKSIIDGVCLDPRISGGYNNPSFGYGGYCLPKDTKQLLSSFDGIPQDLITAIVNSNTTRKNHIANQIIKMLKEQNNSVVGIYRLQMKSGSDNARESGVLGIISILLNQGVEVIIYEPSEIKDKAVNTEFVFENDLKKFKERSEIILANRMSEDLHDVSDKVYSRDIYNYL
ncbi:MAG: nucleotide sugar dehydrogenase [Clostridia bacterium]|nr:nucleotide sugar dehydrogenase [Clostridia bacterium]